MAFCLLADPTAQCLNQEIPHGCMQEKSSS